MPGDSPARRGRDGASDKAARSALADLDARLADELRADELDALIAITSEILSADPQPDPAASGVSVVTGRQQVGARQVASAQRANLLRNFALRRSLLEDSMTSPEVAELLGRASRQTAHDRAAAGTLLAIKDGGLWRFPIWQFDAAGPDGVIEGLPEVISELPSMAPLARLAWFRNPKRGLNSRTPLEALRERDLDLVIAEARAADAG